MASNENDQGYEDSRFEQAVSQNYHCPICLNVLKEPVMCGRNQHYFCTPCITRHLQNSSTCPSCMEELTLKTLSQAPRIVSDCLSELIIRCDYFNRGCRDLIQLGSLKTHVANCGFSPVICSNDGCSEVVNKRDKIHHEAEICDFRKLKCHDCTEMRKKIEEIKMNFDQIAKLPDKISNMQEEVMKEARSMKAEIKDLKDEMQILRQTVYGPYHRNNRGDIIIAGGEEGKSYKNSVETFSWSSKSWSPLKPMLKRRSEASSFVYENHMLVTGGWTGRGWTDTIERLNIQDDRAHWIDFPGKLPVNCSRHKAVNYKDRSFMIGGFNAETNKTSDNIYEVVLIPSYSKKLLSKLTQPRKYHGVELHNDKIFIVGGTTGDYSCGLDTVMMYDINKNECEIMTALPYAVSDMATVTCGNNVFLLGGVNKNSEVLNSVVMYDVTTEKSKILPSMNYKRRECAAVSTGDVIVVMGGRNEKGNCLNSVECFSFDHQAWEELPPMIEPRACAAAVAK